MERCSAVVWWFPVVFVMALATPAVGLNGFVAEGYVRGTTQPSGPAAQVFIDTQILQASDNFTGALGVDWDVELEASPRGPAVELVAVLNQGSPNIQLNGHASLWFETEIIANALTAPDGSALPKFVPIGLRMELLPSIAVNGAMFLGTTLTASAQVVADPKLSLPTLAVSTSVSIFGSDCNSTIVALELTCGGRTTVYGTQAETGVVSTLGVEVFISGFYTGTGSATVRAYADPILMIDPMATFGNGYWYADFFDVEVSPDVVMSVPEVGAGALLAVAGVLLGEAPRRSRRRR